MAEAIHAHRNPKYILTEEALRSGNTVRLKAQGASMLPAIWPGDTLTIESVKASAVRVGDVVLICRDDRFFLHRLVRIQRTGDELTLVARGDSVPQDDLPASQNELVGRVTWIERRSRVFMANARRSLLNRAAGALFGRSVLLVNAALQLTSYSEEALAIQEHRA